MGSKVNSQQALVHWPREITKGKLGQKAMKFGANLGKVRQVWANLDKFRQVMASQGKSGQVWASLDQAIKRQNQNETEKIRKGEKIEW